MLVLVGCTNMVFDRKTLVIPDNTKFEENTIITNGDVVINDRCLIRFGIKTDGRIFIGENAIIDGALDSTGDIRVDIFTKIGSDVTSGGNVYFGDKCNVKGKLMLKGDLDVGDSVEIEKGFEAKGWINIRSPIPVVIYIFIYLTQLLNMGHSEEIERILDEIEETDGETIPISETFLFIPNSSIIGVQKSKIDTNVNIGKNCRIIGNLEVKGNVIVGDDTNIHGTIKSTGKIICNKKVEIHGNINATGDLIVEEKTKIAGNIHADQVTVAKDSTINGKIFAKKGISFIEPKKISADEKVKRFESDADVVDEVKNMLE